MICFINRSTVDYDIRLQKYVQACMETNTPYCVIGWDRLRNCSKIYPNEHQYHAYSPYGNGLKSIFPLIGWVFFVLYNLIKLKKQYEVIHACNMENCLISFPAKWFGKKLVLDIYDSERPKIERRLVKILDGTILPSTQRIEQIGTTIESIHNYLEIENVPVIKRLESLKREVEFPEKIHLSYVGVFQSQCRGLENLISLVNSDERILLDIAGTGGGLDQLVKEASINNSRINYYGKVEYPQALSIMGNSDFIVALYYLVDKDHIYASPNKYYESLALGKPIITSKGTLVGNNVDKNNTGYIIEDSIDALKNLFKNIGSKEFKDHYYTKSMNCRSLWEKTYSTYFDKSLKERYIRYMKAIVTK